MVSDAELAFACSYGRPVVGLRIGGPTDEVSEAETMLTGYRRARVVDCAEVGQCAAALAAVLADLEFSKQILEAAQELSE